MLARLKITYLFESTALWGGNKVGFEQAEALSEAGHAVTILSKDSGPTWYPLKLGVTQVPAFDKSTIPESDILVGTFWPTVKAAYESGKGTTVHLCQGYEADYEEFRHLKSEIDEVYSLKIPKLTISPHLDKLLAEKFGAATYYVGQMLNRDILFPSKEGFLLKSLRHFRSRSFRILVVGPFEGDYKNIASALRGIRSAREKFKVPVRLIRVSQFPLSRSEEEITKPDAYYFHVPSCSMGEIYRKADLLVSMSKECEGFGLPALEAMACGIPTILSRISSHTGFGETQD
ncbi:MAG: glycosyltransferase [Nitrospirota bacterium]